MCPVLSLWTWCHSASSIFILGTVNRGPCEPYGSQIWEGSPRSFSTDPRIFWGRRQSWWIKEQRRDPSQAVVSASDGLFPSVGDKLICRTTLIHLGPKGRISVYSTPSIEGANHANYALPRPEVFFYPMQIHSNCRVIGGESFGTLGSCRDRIPLDVKALDFLRFAAACIADTDISLKVEGTSKVWCVADETMPLSLVEQLLVDSLSGGGSAYSPLIALRYLGQILELPSFWTQKDFPFQSVIMFESVVKKILLHIIVLLQDLGLDSHEEIETASFDTEGIDILCAAVLAGVEGWLPGRQDVTHSVEYWYRDFRRIIDLLRHPPAQEILPSSWKRATTGLLKSMIPTVYRAVVICIPVLEEVIALGKSELLPPALLDPEPDVKSAPSTVDVQQSWINHLKPCIIRIMLNKDSLTTVAYMNMYSAIFMMMAKGEWRMRGAVLYANVSAFYAEYTASIYADAPDNDSSVVTYYDKEWERFSGAAAVVNRLLRHLNSNWVQDARKEGRFYVRTVLNEALIQWKNKMFDPISPRLQVVLLSVDAKIADVGLKLASGTLEEADFRTMCFQA
ncbi:hypothetical protein MVEN_01327100 [Mycena venus]|uniref:Cullin N-terminal domain-containing protein n=1 Tax=Mycena venus TaxID=2733690 RepID=A0A8H6Y030_9AGAR|nr:hypothetical protein MVEN_01327100 [Mycena venus]